MFTLDSLVILILVALITVYIICPMGSKAGLRDYQPCRYMGELGLNNPDPGVWPNCYIPGRE